MRVYKVVSVLRRPRSALCLCDLFVGGVSDSHVETAQGRNNQGVSQTDCGPAEARTFLLLDMSGTSQRKRRMEDERDERDTCETRRVRSRPRAFVFLSDESEEKLHREALTNGGVASGSRSRVADEDPFPVLKQRFGFTPEKIPLSGAVLYRFRCPSSGAFRCSSTGLVFVVSKEAELQYRTVQWDEALLQSSGRTPAGPLYDIECPERAVCELHLPHCEPETVDVSQSRLSVAHLSGQDLEFIDPVQITDSHVIIHVTGLSLHGLTAPSEEHRLISGQVLLFRSPKAGSGFKLNVFLLPGNVPVDTVRYKPRSTTEYVDAPSKCQLVVDRLYSVTCPRAESVQPRRALFDLNHEPNFHPLFELRFSTQTSSAALTVQEVLDTKEREVWGHEVDLTGPTCKVRRTHSRKIIVQNMELVRPKFVESVSDPVLDQLLDRLVRKKYMNPEEVDRARVKPRDDKARDVFDTVKRKGSRAAEYFIKKHQKLDPKSELSNRMTKCLPAEVY